MIAALILAASGVLTWHPPACNYVESPWVMKDGPTVYLGGHAGYCCMMPQDDGTGQDRFWVSAYRYGRVSRTSYILSGLEDAVANDDHEIGGYSIIRVGGVWYMTANRTERAYWGQGNRLRTFMFMVGTSMGNLWTRDFIVDRTPIFLPIQPECAQLGNVHEICNGSVGSGQLEALTSTLDGRILLMSKDDVGDMRKTSMFLVHEVNLWTWQAYPRHIADWGYRHDLPGGLLVPWVPSFGDWGRAPGTNVFYAYTGNKQAYDWYQSTEVQEWKSYDEGKNWDRTGRVWKPEGGGCAWDVAVMKNPDGTIASPLTLVTVYAEKCDWATSGSWYLWYWTDGPSPFYQGVRGTVGR